MARRGKQGQHRRGAKVHRQPHDARRLVDAIFERADPVEIGADLLHGEGDATVARFLALLLEYRFGKPIQHIEASGPEGAQITYQFVTSAPRPNRGEAEDAEEE